MPAIMTPVVMTIVTTDVPVSAAADHISTVVGVCVTAVGIAIVPVSATNRVPASSIPMAAVIMAAVIMTTVVVAAVMPATVSKCSWRDRQHTDQDQQVNNFKSAHTKVTFQSLHVLHPVAP